MNYNRVLNVRGMVGSNARWTEGYNDAINRIKSMVHSFKAANVQEVRHGHWKQRMSTLTSVKCSECGTCHEYDTRYCPYCGCRMDGDKR